MIGRKMILIVSTKIRKGLSQSGAPLGRSPAKKEVVEFIAEVRMRDSHIGIAKAIVKKR